MRAGVPEFAPDQPTLESGVSAYVQNAVPVTPNSYGPVGSLNPIGSPITGRCRGAASFRGTDGTVITVAGDETTLSRWDGEDWEDASRGGDPYAVAETENWSFTAFGGELVAVNGVDDPQGLTIGSDADFSDLAGSPPTARFVFQVGDFLVVARIAGAENRVQWPDIRSVTAWASGQADDQDLFIGGRIMGGCGGRNGTIFSENAIYLMVYTGDNKVFEFHPISLERGCAAEGSIAQFGDTIYFLSRDGFWAIGNSGPDPIGQQKINRWFWDRVDPEYLYRISATVDPISRYYLVSYPSLNSVAGQCDSLLIYNPEVRRWGHVEAQIDCLFGARTNVGLTLETLDGVYGNLDAIPFTLDSPLLMGSPTATLAAFGPDKRLGFFNGPNMAAKVQTIEANLSGAKKTFLYPTMPLVNGGSPKVRIGGRNRLNDPIQWGSAVAQNSAGRCPAKSKKRYQVARIEMDAGDTWNHIQGVEFKGHAAGGN